MDKGYK